MQIQQLQEDLETKRSLLKDKDELIQIQSVNFETTEQELKAYDEIIDKLPKSQSCLKSGILLIKVDPLRPFLAQCSDDGWMVIQRRFNGSQDIFWNEYWNGFGQVDGEHFIGLERLYRLTQLQQYELNVRLEHFNGLVSYANYNDFPLGSLTELHKIRSLGSFPGIVQNNLKYKYNRDNDESYRGFCASRQSIQGVWWYKDCRVLLNPDGSYEYDWGQENLKSVEISIRPKATI